MNVKTAIYQFRPDFGKIPDNLRRIKDALINLQADLIVLPELCTTGYQFISREELRKLSEPVPESDTVEFFTGLSKKLNNYIVWGMAERYMNKLYNSAVLAGKGKYIGHYRKAHLFFEEKEIFDKGDTPLAVYNTDIGKLGIMICFDWIFPEVSRILSIKGAQVICHPSNLVLPFCQDAMITRAVENRIFAVTANRTGSEDRKEGKPLSFSGKSQIVGPDGEILLRMNMHDQTVSSALIDIEKTNNKNITQYNNIFQDRRTDLFKDLIT